MLDIANLRVRARKATLLDSISFVVRARTVLAVFGSSGAGKSTLLHAISGLIESPLEVSGRIVLNGTDISTLPPDQRSLHGISIVLQGLGLFPHLSALDNVAYPLRRRGATRSDARERAALSLKRFQLAAQLDRVPSALSGGQQQRVALARAMVTTPTLLLLDEPFKGLEQRMRDELAALVRGTIAHDTAVMLVTHELRELHLAADEVIVLRSGSVLPPGVQALSSVSETGLPLTSPTIPENDGSLVEAQSTHLALSGASSSGQQRSIVVRDVRRLPGSEYMALVEFENHSLRWISVDATTANDLGPGVARTLTFTPLEVPKNG